MTTKKRVEGVQSDFVRTPEWNGLVPEDSVVVLDGNGDPLKGKWVFKNHVLNTRNGSEDIEVFGGKKGREMTRAIKPERVERA